MSASSHELTSAEREAAEASSRLYEREAGRRLYHNWCGDPEGLTDRARYYDKMVRGDREAWERLAMEREAAARVAGCPDEGQREPTDTMVEAMAGAMYEESHSFGHGDPKWSALREHHYPLGKSHYRQKARIYLVAALGAVTASPDEEGGEPDGVVRVFIDNEVAREERAAETPREVRERVDREAVAASLPAGEGWCERCKGKAALTRTVIGPPPTMRLCSDCRAEVPS